MIIKISVIILSQKMLEIQGVVKSGVFKESVEKLSHRLYPCIDSFFIISGELSKLLEWRYIRACMLGDEYAPQPITIFILSNHLPSSKIGTNGKL